MTINFYGTIIFIKKKKIGGFEIKSIYSDYVD